MTWLLGFLYLIGAYTTMSFCEVLHDREPTRIDWAVVLIWPVSMFMILCFDLHDRATRGDREEG